MYFNFATVIRVGLIDKVTFKQRFDGYMEVSNANKWSKKVPGRENGDAGNSIPEVS